MGFRGWGMGWELSCRKIAKKFIRYLMASKRERKFRIMNYELRIMSFSKCPNEKGEAITCTLYLIHNTLYQKIVIPENCEEIYPVSQCIGVIILFTANLRESFSPLIYANNLL